MLRLLLFLSLLLVAFSARAADQPNVLLICVDDLRPELHCFGVDYIQSPHIDALARQGRIFQRHYVQAPTCGASRYALLTGRYGGAGNGAIFDRAKKLKQNPNGVPPSMPAWFRQHGYTTVSVGKVSHHPGGRGGPDWNDEAMPEMPDSWDRHLLDAGAWQHPRGWMHGLANGEIRTKPKSMDVFQSAEGTDQIYPDGINTALAIEQLKQLANNPAGKPFFLAFGILRPHLPFGAPAKYFEPYRNVPLPPIPHPAKPTGKTTWHGSGEFFQYNVWDKDPRKDEAFATDVRKHYAACVSFADAQVGLILEQLDALKLREKTIVVLWGDHGWHLGEHAIWGKHSLFEESLRSPLIISYAKLPAAGESTQAVVETVDIFPTLIELAHLPKADFATGTSLLPILQDPQTAGHSACSYTGSAKTIRTDTHRLIMHKDGSAELYDHRIPDGETSNIADTNAAVVKELSARLTERFQQNQP